MSEPKDQSMLVKVSIFLKVTFSIPFKETSIIEYL